MRRLFAKANFSSGVSVNRTAMFRLDESIATFDRLTSPIIDVYAVLINFILDNDLSDVADVT